jgi:uncharacterized membrane protein YqaE (UPF0057 family)
MRFLLTLVAFVVLIPASYSSLPTSSPVSTEPDAASVKAAVTELNSLSAKEKRNRIKEVKKAVKAYKADKRAGRDISENTLLLVIIAILLPPLAVYLHQGEINSKFWISLLLTLLFYIPGLIYSLIVILGDKKS